MPVDSEGALRDWVIGQGLAGLPEADLLDGFCMRLRDRGFPLARGLVLLDTLHPSFEGRAVRWRDVQTNLPSMVEYARTSEGDAAAMWRRSPFFAALESGKAELRLKLAEGEGEGFSTITDLVEAGMTDYVAFVHRIAPDAVIGEMDSIYSHWATRAPGGFTDAQLATLRGEVPALTLAMKCAALSRVPRTLAEVYLGRDPARRVMGGTIVRGVADRITTVLWFSDLRSYSTLADSAPPEEIIPLLNDYAEAAIEAVHGAGGDVLKLIGDGLLAIFPHLDAPAACRAALAAEYDMRARIEALNDERAALGRPVTTAYVALHFGEVFYGNIGSRERLDFTVVGPAVNEASRIASLCRSVDRSLLVSGEFHDTLDMPLREELVSVGRFALRGVGQARHLYTLDPGIASDPRRTALYAALLGTRRAAGE